MSNQEISKVIRARIEEAGGKFFANENISEYIQAGEQEQLVKEVEAKMLEVLKALVIDTDHDHNTQETAHRVAKMWVNEVFGGRFYPAPKVTSFPNASNYDNLYISGPITVKSTCAHHFQNIVGKCWVGIFPEKEVIGLSKFNRIVDWIVRRPQIQEEMTVQIADALEKYAKTPNVAVIVKAEHHCMTHRGVREHESDMTTSIMRGLFRDEEKLKNEFLVLMNNMKGHD